MDIEKKFRLREAELWYSKQIKHAFKPTESMPKYLKNARRCNESSNQSSLFSLRSYQKFKARDLNSFDKSLKIPNHNRIKRRPLSSVPIMHKSKSFKRQKFDKKHLIQYKSLQFQPSKGKVPIIIKKRLQDYQFSFDLENGVMRSVSVLCKL